MKIVLYIFSSLILLFSITACKKENMLVLKENHAFNRASDTSKANPPALVWSAENQPNPSTISPAIFFTPHQDDETIGMGASIIEDVRIGRPVYVVLFTNGAVSGALEILNGAKPCTYHHTIHHFNLSVQDFIDARNAEFIAACKVLGVHRIYIANLGAGYDESIGLKCMTYKFKELILYFKNQNPNASNKIISGNCDKTPSGLRSDAHRAGAIAMHQLYTAGKITDIRLYRDYVYYYSQKQRTAGWIKPVSTNFDMMLRQRACDEYKYFNPDEGRYAIGFEHSVWELFNKSYWSSYEYIDYPENTCP